MAPEGPPFAEASSFVNRCRYSFRLRLNFDGTRWRSRNFGGTSRRGKQLMAESDPSSLCRASPRPATHGALNNLHQKNF